MPSRFDKYRVKDGITRLGESFLNPVFRDIDLRLAGLEALQPSWEAAVRAVSEFGLARINELVGPAMSGLDAALAAAEAKRQAALDALEELQAAIGDVPGMLGRIDSLESAVPQKADAAALADKAGAAALAAVAAQLPLLVQPDELGHFAIPAGAAPGHVAVVAGFGLYRYDPDATESADGEVVLAPTGGVGRWLLVAPHWDFVWAYLAGLVDDLHGRIGAGLAGKLDAARILSASALLDFPSTAAGSAATLTVAVSGAATSDRVVVTPPGTLPNGVVLTAYVSAAGTVTVRLYNITAAAIDPAAMTFLVTVIKA